MSWGKQEMADATVENAVAITRREKLENAAPVLIVPLLLIVTLPLVDAFPSWVTLTLAGLAMGLMIFLMASGLTLVFGLMDVLNFGHGAFITVGGFVAASTIAALGGWFASPSLLLNLAGLFLVFAAALAAGAVLGLFFERVIIKPVYGAHLKQILITMGALIVAEQLVIVIWGAAPIKVAKPAVFTGSFVVGDVAFERFRLLAVVLGLAVFVALHLVLSRTKIGLLVRAGVEKREMVEALGYRITTVFVGVFIAGSALAALGGVMWAMYNELISATLGGEVLILVFIVVIIGGLGSVRGSFVGALLVGLTTNYVAFLVPKLALGSTVLLMVLILLWRPTGLYPPTKV